MRFQIPQFIEIEDKVLGPFTLKQFIFLMGGGGAAFLMIKMLPSILGWIVGIPFAVLGFGLAYYKYNDKPLLDVLEAAFKFYLSGRLYLWETHPSTKKKGSAQKQQKTKEPPITVARLSESRLEDLAWSLDVQESDKGDNF